MLVFYSLLLSIAFLMMLPLFFWRRQKYAAGFRQRLGGLPEFGHDGREVVWVHCVSVGEANAARPLVAELHRNFPDHRIVVSTTTRTGQELAQNVFADKADKIFYFPFDWKFSVGRALRRFRPSVVLLMETEIWPRFFREVKRSGARLVIVNGRLSEKSFHNYSLVRRFVRRVLEDLDLALMQAEPDAGRIVSLGLDPARVVITGNIKFDQSIDESEAGLTDEFRQRFAVTGDRPLIVAASTHSPEEKWVLEAFRDLKSEARLLIAARHADRFDEVANMIENGGFSLARRSQSETVSDRKAEVILLDSIGELRAVFPLAAVVFVGGSLIPHGGQSVLEPAAAGKAIVTGPYTMNFEAVVGEFLHHDAIIQLPETNEGKTAAVLSETLENLLANDSRRDELGRNAAEVMDANRGAVLKTVQALTPLLIGTNAESEIIESAE
jgi:3-deoxy-D-manno-octulosonic-acid transferase